MLMINTSEVGICCSIISVDNSVITVHSPGTNLGDPAPAEELAAAVEASMARDSRTFQASCSIWSRIVHYLVNMIISSQQQGIGKTQIGTHTYVLVLIFHSNGVILVQILCFTWSYILRSSRNIVQRSHLSIFLASTIMLVISLSREVCSWNKDLARTSNCWFCW